MVIDDEVTDPRVALTAVVPGDVAEATPVVLMVTTPVGTELHVTDEVISKVCPPEYVPVAVSCVVPPSETLRVWLVAVTVMDWRVPLVTVNCVELVTVPD